jgi:hypothetical protein
VIVAVTPAMLVIIAQGVGKLVEHGANPGAALANVNPLLPPRSVVHAHPGRAIVPVGFNDDRLLPVRGDALAILLRDLDELKAAGQGLPVLLNTAHEGVDAGVVGVSGAAPGQRVVVPRSCRVLVLLSHSLDLFLELDGSDGCDEAAGGNLFVEEHSKICFGLVCKLIIRNL